MDVEQLVALAGVRRRLPSPRRRRLIREAAGVSCSELASVVGVDAATVWRWERGTHRPRGRALERYVAVLEQLGGALVASDSSTEAA